MPLVHYSDADAPAPAEGAADGGGDVPPKKRARGEPRAEGTPYRYMGFLSVGDLVRAIVRELIRQEGPAEPQDQAAGFVLPFSKVLNRMAAMQKVAEAFGVQSVGQCLSAIGSDGDLLYKPEAPAVSLDMLVRQGMLRYPPRPDRPPSHRVAIFNSAGQIEDVISQSDVVRYLNDNISQVPEAGKTIAQLGLLSDGIGYPNYEPEPDKGAWTFPASTSAIDCLAEMHSTMRIPAAAIVDENTQVLVGTLSESDLRGLKIGHIPALALPVAQFLIHRHDLLDVEPKSLEWDGYDAIETAVDGSAKELGLRAPPVVVTPDHTLAECIRKLSGERVHRVWVVDGIDTMRPEGCVSCTDVLRAVCSKDTPAKAEVDA